MNIYLSRPDITNEEIEAVREVLQSPDLSLGPVLGKFENSFAEYTGRKHAVAVNSGTSGLFLCMLALDIGPDDEVITTPFTFIASTTSIMMAGAKPVFVDIDPVTLNIDTTRIEEKITGKTKAILPVEVFGNPAGFEDITRIAKEHNLLVIEDCCEALGSTLNGRKAGDFGDMSVFGFYPNKQITTGEGGMILADDEKLADICISLRNQGRAKAAGWLAHERLGFNYRLSDINCALGLVQLKRIEQIKAKRKQVAQWYQQALADEQRLIVPEEDESCDLSWFVFVVRLKDNFNFRQRNNLLEQMNAQGIQVSNYFPPVHLQPFIAEKYGFKKGDFPVTEAVSERTIALPFHNKLTKEEVDTVCKTLKNCLNKI